MLPAGQSGPDDLHEEYTNIAVHSRLVPDSSGNAKMVPKRSAGLLLWRRSDSDPRCADSNELV